LYISYTQKAAQHLTLRLVPAIPSIKAATVSTKQLLEFKYLGVFKMLKE
jgi:hypothetical protein